MRKKDYYLEGLRSALDMCELVLMNRQAFSAGDVQKAETVKAETERNIAQYLAARGEATEE